MKVRIAVLASAAGLVSSFVPAARAHAQAAPSSPVAITHASLKLELELRSYLRLERSHDFGLTGLNLRLQPPKRFAPYVEGRMGDGVTAARPDGALMIPGTPIGLNGGLGPNLMFTRGVDVGIDVHKLPHGYLSLAVGWLRSATPVGGFDANDRLVSQAVWHDAFLFKIGFTM